MKRSYELMFVMSPDVDAKDTKKVSELVKKLLSDVTCTVVKTDILGKKFLAYPIQKRTEGLYVLVTLEADAIVVGKIESKSKLEPLVLRYLLTVK